LVFASIGVRGAGARNVMNVVNSETSSWSSFTPPAQLPTTSSVSFGIPATDARTGWRSSQPVGDAIPLGFDSSEKSRTDVPRMQCCVVMPISLT
jgi:hypothetical protein